MLIPKPFAAMVSTRSDEVARDISFMIYSRFHEVSPTLSSPECQVHDLFRAEEAWYTVLNRLQRDDTTTK